MYKTNRMVIINLFLFICKYYNNSNFFIIIIIINLFNNNYIKIYV